jgi:hypothetical protein
MSSSAVHPNSLKQQPIPAIDWASASGRTMTSGIPVKPTVASGRCCCHAALCVVTTDCTVLVAPEWSD